MTSLHSSRLIELTNYFFVCCFGRIIRTEGNKNPVSEVLASAKMFSWTNFLSLADASNSRLGKEWQDKINVVILSALSSPGNYRFIL